MKKNVYFMMEIILLCLFAGNVSADCSADELKSLKKELDKVTVTYKHLGEVIKEDGTITYNEFMVTASNIPEDIYINLYPMTSEKFETLDNNKVRIKLTTGSWNYNFYSSKCKDIIGSISIKLPTFNYYSLDPLCSGIDGEEFKLCGKYYEEIVSREDFEQRIKYYRQLHVEEENNEEKEEDLNIFKYIADFVSKYYIYIIVSIIFIILIILGVSIILKMKKKNLLE